MMSQSSPAGSWFVDIRKAALIACIAALLDLSIPTWSLSHSMLARASTGLQQWTIPLAVLGGLFSLITPAFCFALYRNEGTLRLSKILRLWALTAAVVWGTLVAMELPALIRSLSAGDRSVLSATPWTVNDLSVVLSELANVAGILLLSALYRHASNDSDPPASVLCAVMRCTINERRRGCGT
jgi:hypothetical protein